MNCPRSRGMTTFPAEPDGHGTTRLLPFLARAGARVNEPFASGRRVRGRRARAGESTGVIRPRATWQTQVTGQSRSVLAGGAHQGVTMGSPEDRTLNLLENSGRLPAECWALGQHLEQTAVHGLAAEPERVLYGIMVATMEWALISSSGLPAPARRASTASAWRFRGTSRRRRDGAAQRMRLRAPGIRRCPSTLRSRAVHAPSASRGCTPRSG